MNNYWPTSEDVRAGHYGHGKGTPPVDGGEFGWPQASEREAMLLQEERDIPEGMGAIFWLVVALGWGAVIVGMWLVFGRPSQ